MCLACQESDYFFRLYVADRVARGEMPPGMTEDDLRELGIPLPGTFTAGSAFAVDNGAEAAPLGANAADESKAPGESADRE
jgi:hypothetical protein